jgi:hypothetical protein
MRRATARYIKVTAMKRLWNHSSTLATWRSIRIIVSLALYVCGHNAFAQTDFRYRLMTIAEIDGYPNEDDLTAVSRFLTAAGNRQIIIPDDIADRIVSSIEHQTSDAAPRLIGAYMAFLRGGVTAPPFHSGAPGAARYRLLSAIVNDLAARHTPLGNLALLMFKEIDDPSLRQRADTADYAPLRAFPWLVGHSDWMDWIFIGLHPDEPTSVNFGSPEYPVTTDQAKAGLLPHVRAYLADLDISPPVRASIINFSDYTDDGPYSWGHLKKAERTSKLDQRVVHEQLTNFARMQSRRIAATLGVSAYPDEEVITLDSDYERSRRIQGSGSIAMGYYDAIGYTSKCCSENFIRLAKILESQESRLLALGSYGLLINQRKSHGLPLDIGMHEIFVRLSRIDPPAASKKTHIVESFVPSLLATAAGSDLSKMAECNPRATVVVGREIALRSRNYIETLEGDCSSGKSARFVKHGVISTDMARMLEINPYFLDIADVSLTARELDAGRRRTPDNIDLVRADPARAFTLNLALLAHPEAPWSYVRDALLQSWPLSTEWFTPGWRPVPSLSTTLGISYHDQIVLRSLQDFNSKRSAALQEQMNLLEHEARYHFVDGVRGFVNAIHPTFYGCDQYQDSRGTGYSCSDRPTGKNKLVAQLNRLLDEADAFGRKSRSVMDSVCATFRAHDYDYIITLINGDGTEFLTQYVSKGCFIAADGPLSPRELPAEAKDWLLIALQDDPIFLNRLQIDFIASSWNEPNPIIEALSVAGTAREAANETERYLESTDLLFYLPSIRAPLDYRDLKAQGVYDWIAERSPFGVVTSPLMRSLAGQQLAADLTQLDILKSRVRTLPTQRRVVVNGSLLVDSLTTRMRVTDSFIQSLYGAERKAIAKVDLKVDEKVAETLSAWKPQQSEFFIALSLGIGPAIVPGLSFTFNGVGLNVELSGMRKVMIVPEVPPFKIPGLPAVFPGTKPFGRWISPLEIPIQGGGSISRGSR